MRSSTKVLLITLSIVIAIVLSCSVVKNDDSKKDVKAFVSRFGDSLALPVDVLLEKFFHTTQSKETISEALLVLKNADTSGIQCRPDFSLAAIMYYEVRTQVTIPVTFDTTGLGFEHINPETSIVFWIEPTNNDFVITEVDGTRFYQTYTSVKNAKHWAKERKEELIKRLPIYAIADSLDKTLDSVIWYAKYNEELYFYVVTGTWRNYFMNKEEVFAGDRGMGLVNAKGDTLIPMDYELIGTIGFVQPGLVEIKRDGKYGYFSLDSGKVVVEPLYDMIIPFEDNASGSWALVLKDSTYGWISQDYEFFDGYPSDEAYSYAENYSYLKSKIVLQAGNQVFCEIPSPAHIGYGIIIPPSYYVKNNLFDQIIGGINTTKVPMNGWTDYIESSKSMVARIGDEINALISVMEQRYIGGREEFYGSSQVTFVNAREEEIGSTEMPTDQEIIFTHLGDGILELKATATGYYYYTPGRERDIPAYKYFQIEDESTLTELTSNRIFPFTQFVKIDSSYITGDFSVYDHTEEGTYEEDGPGEPGEDIFNYRDILTASTLGLIRDEILVANGRSPVDYSNVQMLERQGYTVNYENKGENYGGFPEADRHNIEFLNRVIPLVQEYEMTQQSEGGEESM